MKFLNKIIDYCSSKLKYNKRYMKWDLKGHPLNFKDKRFYLLIILLLLPTIEMAICIHVVKDIYLAIVVFHLTITLGPITYLFLNSKLIKDIDYSGSDSISNSSISIKNNNQTPIYNNSYDIYSDSDEIQSQINSKESSHLIDIYSKDLNKNIKLSTKIFNSLFSVPQLVIGLILMSLGLLFGSLCYYLLAYFIPNVVSSLYEYGMLSYSFFAEYIFYIYFSVVNPILEEFFWRMFLLNTFGTTKLKRFIITACYSFYHFVVLVVFYNIFFSMFLTLVVFVGGILFLYIAKYIGPLASILSHTSADIIIVFIISNMTLKWFPYLIYN